MEFYLWGKAALEDMLHLPKNDHILFTFFGISLVSRRKSRATEIRAVVSAKNKLFNLLGDHPQHHSVLLRDTKDVHYPYKAKYKDFRKRPRWREYPAIGIDPLGLIVQVNRYFAFRDPVKKVWDYSDAIDMVSRQVCDEEQETHHDLHENVESFWEFFQESHQAMYIVNGLVRFDAIVLIDGKGDLLNDFPHIYVDFQGDRGPFVGFYEYLEIGEYHDESLDGLKRAKIFPQTFSKPRFGTIYRDKTISLNDRTRVFLKNRGSRISTLYDCDERFQFLIPGDVIGVEQTEDHDGNQVLIKITNKRQVRAKDILKQRDDDPMAARAIEEQIERSLKPKDTVVVYECKIVYEHELERK